MKKYTHKIFIKTIILSLSVFLMTVPCTNNKTAYASDISEKHNVDVNLNGSNNISSVGNILTLTNKGDNIDLSDMKIRYYFTSDENSNGDNFACYYSCISGADNKYSGITEHVHESFEKLTPSSEKADSYLEITFDKDAETFNSSDVLTLNTAINHNNWSPINSDDDYSFNDSSKTVVLVNDKIVSGTPPYPIDNTLPKITIGGVTVKGGETVNVPINISNIKYKGISKFHIKVSYDPEIFESFNYLDNIPKINKLSYKTSTGKGVERYTHTVDIGYDFTKDDTTKALYEEGDYVYLPLGAVNNLEDGISYLKIVAEPILTDASGKEYSGDNIIVLNKPITLEYNPIVMKDPVIMQNYLEFTENTIKDTDITVKKYESEITSITCETYDSDIYTLKQGTDYEFVDGILTLKESFLSKLFYKNAYITVHFDYGKSQSIFVNNSRLKSTTDPNMSDIDSNEATVSLARIEASEFDKSFPLTLAITNIGNKDIDIGRLELQYYFKGNSASSDRFEIDYCSILGSNKDLRYAANMEGIHPFPEGSSEYYSVNSFEYNAGSLKPGKTLLLMMHYKGDSSITPIMSPLINYNNKLIFGW